MYTTNNNGYIIEYMDTLSDALVTEERKIRKVMGSPECTESKHLDWLMDQKQIRLRILQHLKDVKSDLLDLHEPDDYFNNEL